jgi:ribose transport system substrate-binding protein
MATTFKRAQWAGALASGVMTVWLLLAGCGAGGEATIFETAASSAVAPMAAPMAPPAQYQIGLIMKTLTNPFFIEMEKGARRAQSELGVELVVKTGAQETSIEQQIAIVEEMITAGMDAIVIAPGSSTELIPVLKKAQDAGIVCRQHRQSVGCDAFGRWG